MTANASSVGWETPAASGISTVRDEGTALIARSTINFTGAGVVASDNAGSTRTDVAVYGLAPKTVSSRFHYPTYGPLTSSFGTYQRAYYIPFVGGSNSFSTAYAIVDVANASGVLNFGVYEVSGISLSRIASWGTVAASSTGSKSVTISGGWTPTVGNTYYLGILITGSSAVKLRGSSLVAAVQSNGNNSANVPPWGAFYGDSLTSLPATDYAVYNGLITDIAPVVYLYTS